MFKVVLITFGISLGGQSVTLEEIAFLGEDAQLLCEAAKHRREFTFYVPREYLTVGFVCEKVEKE